MACQEMCIEKSWSYLIYHSIGADVLVDCQQAFLEFGAAPALAPPEVQVDTVLMEEYNRCVSVSCCCCFHSLVICLSGCPLTLHPVPLSAPICHHASPSRTTCSFYTSFPAIFPFM